MQISWFIQSISAAVLWGFHYNIIGQVVTVISPLVAYTMSIMPLIVISFFYQKTIIKDVYVIFETRLSSIYAGLATVSGFLASIMAYCAINKSNPYLVSIIEISYPFFVYLIANYFFKNLHKNYNIISLILIFSGNIFIIMDNINLSNFNLNNETVGYIFALISALIWGWFYNFINLFPKKVHPITICSLSIIPTVMFFPFIYIELLSDSLKLFNNPLLQFYVLLTGILSITANILIYKSIEKSNPVSTSIVEVSYPLFVILIAIAFFDNIELTTNMMLGAITIVMGNILIAIYK